MPQLAFDIGFCTELHKLQAAVKKGVFQAWERFAGLTVAELLGDHGLNLEKIRHARDPHIRTIRITAFWRGVVLAPESGETFVLLKVLPHDDAIAWAKTQRASINQVTRAVELRDAAALDRLTPAFEQATTPAETRLFAGHSDGDLSALGVDADTLRRARTLLDKDQLDVFAPFFPPDQCEVLQYLAEGFTVEEVWRDVVAHRGATTAAPPDQGDFDTAIRHSGSRIAMVTAPEELHDILTKPFAAWRTFLHPAQHRIAYRPSYAGPAQVTGGPGTGKTVVALHRVRHLLRQLADGGPADGAPNDEGLAGPAPGGDRILLTSYTNALVAALRTQLFSLVDEPRLRERVDVATVDTLAAQVLATTPGGDYHRLVTGAEETRRWAAAAAVTDGHDPVLEPRFLAQEYRHVILAQDVTSEEEYLRTPRHGRGSRLPASARSRVWQAIQRFTTALAADGARTYLQQSAEAARLVRERGPLYRHIVVDEAQDLHPAQWRLLRAAVAQHSDDLFVAGDPHQRIYDSRVSLRALDIHVTGRSTRMRKNYRSTQEILRWASALMLGRPVDGLTDGVPEETLHGYRSALRGSLPTLLGAADEQAELDAVVRCVTDWTGAGVPPAEIGVTARFHRTCDAVVHHLVAAGVPAVRLRSDLEEDHPAVRVGTMHAVKGLEFRCVAVVGLCSGVHPFPRAVTPAHLDRIQHDADMTAERCLVFVACTRARDRLHVSWHGEPSPFLTEAALV